MKMSEDGDTTTERPVDSSSPLSTGSSNAIGGGGQHLSSSALGPNVVMLPEYFEPGEYDVICGRGKKSFHHLGNSYLRDVVNGCLERYANASKVDKSFILCEVVDQIRLLSPNGGFVKKDASCGRWYQVDDFLAREKTSQAFRDALHDLYKSSNSSKKKRRHAERTSRHILQYHRGHSSSSLCTDDFMASDQGSATCSTTTNCSSFVTQIPTLATVFTPSSAVMGVSALMGGMGSGTHGNQHVMGSPFRSQESKIIKSNRVIGSAARSLPQQQLSHRSLQLKLRQEPMQQQSVRSVVDPLRHSCPNMKFNCSTGRHGMTQGATPLASLSMEHQQQLLSKSLQMQMLQEPQQLQQQSARSVVDPLRRSCPNIKLNCDTVGGRGSLQLESNAKELDITQEPKPIQQPSSSPNIKLNFDVANGCRSFQLERHPEELDLSQSPVPLLQEPQPLQQSSARSVADPLRRSCPNIKFKCDIGNGNGSYVLQSHAKVIDMSQGAEPDMQKPQQLKQPFVRPIEDKLRRSCPNIKFISSGSFHLASHAEGPNITQDSVPLLQDQQQLQQTSVRSAADQLNHSCPNIKFNYDSGDGSGSFQGQSHTEDLDMTESSVPLSSVSMQEQQQQQQKQEQYDIRLQGQHLNSSSVINSRSMQKFASSVMTADTGVIPQSTESSTAVGTSPASRQCASLPQPKDHSLQADSRSNLYAGTPEPQEHHDDIFIGNDDFHNFLKSMDKDDFPVDDLNSMGEDDFNFDNTNHRGHNDISGINQGEDILFDYLVHFAEPHGRGCGNPFEPDPIPEITSRGV